MNRVKPIIVVAILYALFGRISLLLALPPSYASPIWPSAGIALAFMIRYGYGIWPGIFIGQFLAQILSYQHGGEGQLGPFLMLAAGISVGPVIQAIFSTFLAKKIVGKSIVLVNSKSIGLFFLFCGVFGCFVSATVGIGNLFLHGVIPLEGCLESWVKWWIGDSVGVFLFTPLTLTWINNDKISWRRRRAALSVWISIVYFLIVGICFAGTLQEQKRLELLFSNEANAFTRAMQYKMKEVNILLDSIQSFFNNSESVTRDKFGEFLEGVKQKLPEVKSVSWVPIVKAEEVERYKNLAANDGIENYHIKQVGVGGKLRPADPRPVYYPIFYIEPQKGNEVALGIDNGSEPNRLETTLFVRDQGVAKASAPIILGQDAKEGLYSLLTILPIYARGVEPQTVEMRRDSIYGFVTIAAQIKKLVLGALEILEFSDEIQVTIYDKELSLEKPVYVHKNKETMNLGKQIFEHPNLSIAGREWKLVFQPTSTFNSENQTMILWWLLWGGFFISSTMSMLILFVTGQTLEIARVVDIKTKELKLANHELKRSNEELEQFASIAAHDLREPLRKMISFSQLVEKKLGHAIEGKTSDYLHYIVDNAQRMNVLIRDLLDYGRVSRKELKFSEIDFNDVVNESLSNLEFMIKDNQAEIDVSEMPKLKAHRAFMVSLFQNLIANAIEYRSDEVPRIQIFAEKVSDTWEFSIQDNGEGIKPEFTETIFKIFQRLHPKNSKEGSGIGLTICRRIVEKHGGKIWLATPQDFQGSIFKFALPQLP